MTLPQLHRLLLTKPLDALVVVPAVFHAAATEEHFIGAEWQAGRMRYPNGASVRIVRGSDVPRRVLDGTFLDVAVVSPKRYAIGSDTRLTTHIACRHQSTSKTFSCGPLLGAWSGTLSHAQAFTRAATGEPGDTREEVEAWLLAVRGAALQTTGQRPPDAAPFLELDVLLVGPAGVVVLRADGALVWQESVGVIGCADEFVLGWLDRGARPTVDDIEEAILAAALRYPGVGGPVEVLRG